MHSVVTIQEIYSKKLNHAQNVLKKALLLAKVHNEINEAEKRKKDGYLDFKKQLFEYKSREAVQRAMLYCTEQCVALTTLRKCSRLIEETL